MTTSKTHTSARRAAGLSVLVLAATLGTVGVQADDIDASGDVEWSVQYIIDQSQDVDDKSQFSGPRDNRGLALSPDLRYLYAGYNNGGGEQPFQVRKIDTTEPDVIDANVAFAYGYRGKAIDTDDVGRVYLAEGSNVTIFDPDLAAPLFVVAGLTQTEGVATTRESGQLVMYTSDRSDDALTRWELDESGTGISGAMKAGFGGTGVLPLPGAGNLRGVEVDPAGRIWVADIGGDKVYRVDPSGLPIVAAAVADAIDIDFDDDEAFVTQYTSRQITVLDQETLAPSAGSPLAPPWMDLRLDPDGQSGNGALSGIAMAGSSFYVANEAGQTADERSAYGRTDSHSGTVGGEFYTDVDHDDNDAILKVTTGQPDLVLGKGDDRDPVRVGSFYAYLLNVTNGGDGDATNVTLVDTLPEDIRFVSASADQGSCTQAGRNVTCLLGTIGPGGSVEVEIAVQATGGPRHVENTATVASDQQDLDPSDNTASETTRIEAGSGKRP